MAQHLGRRGSKSDILAECRRDLANAIGRGAAASELAEAIEALRSAELRELKRRLSRIVPSERGHGEIDAVNAAAAHWAALPQDVVLTAYRSGNLAALRPTKSA